MAKPNDLPYTVAPVEQAAIPNMVFLRFGRAYFTPLVGHYGPNYLFLKNDYDCSGFPLWGRLLHHGFRWNISEAA
jgi:hypothetical protein